MWRVCNGQTVPHLSWSVWCGVEEEFELGESVLVVCMHPGFLLA